MGGETRIRHVHSRGFDEPLPEVLVVRRNDQDLRSRLQHTEPLRDRRNADAEGGAERSLAKHLSVAARDEREKAAKRRKVPYSRYRANVALEIGLQVRSEPELRILRPGGNLGLAAAKERNARGLATREGQQPLAGTTRPSQHDCRERACGAFEGSLELPRHVIHD